MALECRVKNFDLGVYLCPDEDASPVDPLFGSPYPKTCIGPSGVWTVHIATPHILHVRSSDERVCLDAEVTRVAKCYKNCELGDFRYCLPSTCPFTYLPAGHYEIIIPEQGVVPVADGDTITATLVLEPVGTDFYDYLTIMNSTAGVPRC